MTGNETELLSAYKMKPLKIAVLASGRGSNLAALISAIERGELHAQIVLVVSNKADAGALEIARSSGIPALHLSSETFPSLSAFEQALLSSLQLRPPDVIALAGYLKKIGGAIIHAYKNRIVNIHPALLPAFGGKGMYGLKVHQAVLEYGCKVTGVTVHLVDDEYDTGPPILQRCVPVLPDDTPETLAARVLEVEHKVYAEALQLFAEDRIEVVGRQVRIKP
jgi:phosphoribosylglycinamide formyltransferase-1